jgi:hypothetical protein
VSSLEAERGTPGLAWWVVTYAPGTIASRSVTVRAAGEGAAFEAADEALAREGVAYARDVTRMATQLLSPDPVLHPAATGALTLPQWQ